MAFPVSLAPAIPAASTAPRAPQVGELRRQLRRELFLLSGLFEKARSHDELSRDCALWHANFLKAVNLGGVPEEEILKKFATLLQEILVESAPGMKDKDREGHFIHFPLGEDAVLGSDGFTYAPILLRLRLSNLKEPYRHRSPLLPQDERSFITTPHPIVPSLVRWLQQRALALELPEEMRQEYERCLREGILPPLPTERTERARHIVEERKRKEAEKDQKMLENLQTHQASLNKVQERFDTALKEKFEQPLSEKMEELKAKHETLFADGEIKERELKEKITAHLDAVQTDLAQLETRNGELRESISKIAPEMMSVEQQGQHLDLLVGEVRERISERKKSSGFAFFATSILIGGCALLTCGMSSALAAGGISAHACVTPAVKGGLQLTATLPF